MATEKTRQYEVLDWLNKQQGVFAIQINNRAPYDPIRKTYIKMPKYSPLGTPDILVMLLGRMFWIEMKTDTGKQSVHQLGFEKKMKSLDLGYYVVRDLVDAENALERERER